MPHFATFPVGCSGLSYVMDFATEKDIQEDDEIDEYTAEKLKCVVDAKSMLYLYGLELDFSEELIGGGFKFFNPNAEDRYVTFYYSLYYYTLYCIVA